MSFDFAVVFVEGPRLVGAGLATIGLTGAGIGIEQSLGVLSLVSQEILTCDK